MGLLEFTPKGIYCRQADVYIDPWKPVKRALITHGHADHSRSGHEHYLCTEAAEPVIRYRLGKINLSSIPFGKNLKINEVNISFHPAGHIVGSAQIRVEYRGEVWVVSGDYKIEDDGLAEPYEPVRCHSFITESTFGLPVYKWKDQFLVYKEINDWWRQNKQEGKVTVLSAYALGKAQRLLHHLDHSIGPIFTHQAVENTNQVLRAQGIYLKPTIPVTPEVTAKEFSGGIIIASSSAINSPGMAKVQPIAVGVASGWMALRGAHRRRSVDRGFVLSDHADWDGLNEAIRACGAERVFVTHGYTTIFRRWLEEQGLDAQVVKTKFEGEPNEINETPENSDS